ncbi:MAG: exodeoxyribonuclease III, partial [Chthoniobacterales bacterium]
MRVASWNVNSIRARTEQVRKWLERTNVDVLLLQELKGSEFPAAVFEELGYQSAAVTQKTYNGVAILSRTPMEIISKRLLGDELDSHARFLEVMIEGMRLVNIYLPNGNPIGSDKFAYKLAWMDRLALQMRTWLLSGVPTI